MSGRTNGKRCSILSYYKTQSPYDAAKKAFWSEKMSKAMPLWLDLTSAVASKLMQTSNNNLKKKPTALIELGQLNDTYKQECLQLDNIYYSKMFSAMLLDQAGKAGYDLDEFKEILESLNQPKPTKKPAPKKSVKKSDAATDEAAPKKKYNPRSRFAKKKPAARKSAQ